jgi:hypothetical protein
VTLEPLVQAVGFPFDASVPVVCAPAAGALHALARDAGSGRVRHAALDAEAQPVRPPVELDAAFVMGLATDGRVLAAVVALADGQTPALLTLGPRGDVRDLTPLSPPAPLAVQPVPLMYDGDALAILATADARLLTVTAGGSVGEAIDCRDMTVELAAAVVDGGAVVARVHGDRQALQLMRIELPGGALRGIVDVAEQAVLPGVHVLGDRLALVWTSGRDGQAWLGWFDGDLGATDIAAALTATTPGERVRSARLLAGGESVALSYVTARPIEQIVPPEGDGPSTMRAGQAFAHYLAELDAGLGPPQPVAEPGAVFHDGGWLGTRLLLLHGLDAPVVSVFG